METGALTTHFLEKVRSSPGGFVWWYVDVTTAEGAGLVLIWSEGLPFLAGSRGGGSCAARPALSVALYDRTSCVFYALEEHTAAQLDADGSGWLGRSTFLVSDSGEERSLEAQLDVTIPGSVERLRGSVRLRGPSAEARGEARGPSSEPSHLWSPRVVLGRAEVRLEAGARRWDLLGSGYFDGNASTSALSDQGIDTWRWGRVHWPDRALIFYDVTALPGDERAAGRYLFEAKPDGTWRSLDAELDWCEWRRATYGIRAPRCLRITSGSERLVMRARALVDDGPFYQRFLVDAEDTRGEVGRGVYEIVEARSIDRAWQRPFVKMRTHRVGRGNSAWLPLFSGPREGRVGRLLSSWVSGSARETELEARRHPGGDA